MRTLSVVWVVVLVGCASPPPTSKEHIQTRVVVSRQFPPNVMFLVDRSASMGLAIDPSAAGCSATCPVGCSPSCRTRLGEVQTAVRAALAARGASASFGLSVFPDSTACSASSAGVLEPISAVLSTDEELQAKASIVANRLDAVSMTGQGHPISDALVVVGALPELNRVDDAKQDFVLLITSGTPDCGSMDVMQAIQAMRARSIKTIIVGFGTDASSPAAAATLDAMAEAGGFARTCPNGTDAECGANNRCLAGGVCERKGLQANTATELGDALISMFTPLPSPNPCVFQLEVVPATPDALTVLVDGVVVAPGADTWSLGSDTVTFLGPLCTRLMRASPAAPMRVEIRVATP